MDAAASVLQQQQQDRVHQTCSRARSISSTCSITLREQARALVLVRVRAHCWCGESTTHLMLCNDSTAEIATMTSGRKWRCGSCGVTRDWGLAV